MIYNNSSYYSTALKKELKDMPLNLIDPPLMSGQSSDRLEKVR